MNSSFISSIHRLFFQFPKYGSKAPLQSRIVLFLEFFKRGSQKATNLNEVGRFLTDSRCLFFPRTKIGGFHKLLFPRASGQAAIASHKKDFSKLHPGPDRSQYMHNDGIRVEINLRNFPKCVISSSNVASIQRFSFHIFFLRLECRKREKMTRETAKKKSGIRGVGRLFFCLP